MKFKVGDKVRIKTGLKNNKFYGRVFFNEKMETVTGKVFTIGSIPHENRYTLSDFAYPKYYWSSEMLEPLEAFSIGDTVYAKNIERPLTILRKAWVVCYQDQTSYEHFVEERYLSKTKPLKEITEKELAEMGFVIKK